jgi:hypothetical protein
VHAIAPTGAAHISTLFDLTVPATGTDNYCKARATIRLSLPAGTTRDDIGELEDTMWDINGAASYAQCTNYAPVNSVISEAQVSVMASSITALAKLPAYDYVAAEAAYKGSALEALAKEDRTGNAAFDEYVSFYGGDKTFLDTYVTSCFTDGEPWATAGNKSRTECIEKTVQDLVPVAAIFDHLEDALKEVNLGNTGIAQAAAHVDRAYALYKGGKQSAAVYDRGQKRGANYLDATGAALVNSDGVALVNVKIEAAFRALQTAVLADTLSSVNAAAAAQTINSQLKIIYMMATMR